VKFTNVSGCVAGWTAGYEPDGREMLIVIIKAAFQLPARGEEPERFQKAVPLVQADVFTGEPGFSAPKFETDYAHRKPFCDVLVVGSAYAPAGKPAARVQVGLQVGAMTKEFAVVGERIWQKSLGVAAISQPRAFSKMAISYDVAFGGTDRTLEARAGQVFTYVANPVGRGYWHETADIDGKPLPNTEAVGEQVTNHKGPYTPASFSPVGRNWTPRVNYAGTYDKEWLDNNAPFWPADFDYRYFQAAAQDQWIAYPTGGEPVVLRNLTPDGLRSFRLPVQAMPVTFIPYRGYDVSRDAVVDTVLFEPDEERFSVTWRTSLPLGKSLFDVKETIAGEMPRGWHRARRTNKAYYPGLGALVAARRGETLGS
jgi:hypothetical protein